MFSLAYTLSLLTELLLTSCDKNDLIYFDLLLVMDVVLHYLIYLLHQPSALDPIIIQVVHYKCEFWNQGPR